MRTILDTVFVAGRTKKWRGALPDFDLARLPREMKASRDDMVQAIGIDQDIFRA